jgi:hypothetical protein
MFIKNSATVKLYAKRCKQVDNTLFCVDLKNLERHSEPIRNIFEIPPAINVLVEVPITYR